jgi:hypothetical protein
MQQDMSHPRHAIQVPLTPLDELMQTPGFLAPLNHQQIASAMQRHLMTGVGVPEWQDLVAAKATEGVESDWFKYQVCLP